MRKTIRELYLTTFPAESDCRLQICLQNCFIWPIGSLLPFSAPNPPSFSCRVGGSHLLISIKTYLSAISESISLILRQLVGCNPGQLPNSLVTSTVNDRCALLDVLVFDAILLPLMN